MESCANDVMVLKLWSSKSSVFPNLMEHLKTFSFSRTPLELYMSVIKIERM
jgi:hypothetical protein